jgi:exodeoxyribonuclease VII large subunit
VYGRPELFAAKGEFKLRALTIERFGLGDHLAALERLKKRLAADGVFDEARKRRLPFLPRKIGLVTGNDAAAKRDVLSVVTTRFPPAHVVVAETYVQGPRAAGAVVAALRDLCAIDGVDVIVLARGGGSFDDLLPFSDEQLVRAVSSCPVPVVSAVGHEQDTPLCDLAADVRASTPTAAGRIVVPDLAELNARLDSARSAVARGVRRRVELERERTESLRDRLRRAPAHAVERERRKVEALNDRLRRAPLLLLERKRASLEQTTGRLRVLSPKSTLSRGYAIVRGEGGVVRASSELARGAHVDVQLAEGAFGATVEDTR